MPGTPTTGVMPASYQTPIDAGLPSRTAVPVDQNNAAVGVSQGLTSANTDQFAYIQDQLRRLGATYYLLESWGNDQPLYRFYCKMAVGGNASYTRYFEATDASPLQAMALVLRQVETWHDGGSLQVDPSASMAGQ